MRFRFVSLHRGSNCLRFERSRPSQRGERFGGHRRMLYGWRALVDLVAPCAVSMRQPALPGTRRIPWHHRGGRFRPQPRQDNARPTCGRAGAGGLPTPRVWSVAFPAQSWRNLRCGIILRGSSLMLRPSMRRHHHPGYLQRRSGGGPPRRGCITAFAGTREAWWIWSGVARAGDYAHRAPETESHGLAKRFWRVSGIDSPF